MSSDALANRAQPLDGALHVGVDADGVVGDGDARAGFAIADLEHEIVEFWRVPYEIAAVQSRMRAARLPEALAQRLSLGR